MIDNFTFELIGELKHPTSDGHYATLIEQHVSTIDYRMMMFDLPFQTICCLFFVMPCLIPGNNF